MANLQEIWKPVKNYEGIYEVSSLGRVKALPRIRSNNHKYKEIIMKQTDNGRGYMVVSLKHSGKKRKNHYVHIMAATAFHPNPHNFPQVNHKDATKENNRITNLEWCTLKQNMEHASKNGLISKGEKSGLSKLKNAEVFEIKKLSAMGVKGENIAKGYRVSKATISRIINNQLWKHL